MSAYANVARAWGAEVRGWDQHETIFSETLEGVELDLGGDPRPPDGFEVVVSTAHRDRIDGAPRAAFLAELVAARPSIVVTGAHGKTTTAAMIAHALRETGDDPAWIIGGIVPQLGGNAGTGSGWLVVEGDESDRSVFELRPRLAVVTNVELDHFGTYGSSAELQEAIDEWLEPVPEVVCGWELEPVAFHCRFPESTTGGTPRPRSRPSGPNRRRGATAEAALSVLRGRRPALPARRRARWRGGRGRLWPQPDRDPRGARDGTGPR